MEIRHATKYAFKNRQTLANSDHCGCYFCLKIFNPTEIKEWTDEGETALCPFCEVDAILANEADCKISKEFLQTLHDYWFTVGGK